MPGRENRGWPPRPPSAGTARTGPGAPDHKLGPPASQEKKERKKERKGKVEKNEERRRLKVKRVAMFISVAIPCRGHKSQQQAMLAIMYCTSGLKEDRHAIICYHACTCFM